MAKTALSNTSSTSNWTPTHDEIAAQAYQIYLREGCAEGRDMDHWLRAESELREHALSNGNGHDGANQSNERSSARQQEPAPRNRIGAKPEQVTQSSALPASVAPPTTPIAQVNRGTTPKKNSGKREAAAVK